jgi:hypothetical protein
MQLEDSGNLVELAELMRRVVQNPNDELAVARLKARLRKSDTREFTKALILVMLVDPLAGVQQ